MPDVDTSAEAVERLVTAFDLPRDVDSIVTEAAPARALAATLRTLHAERDALAREVERLRDQHAAALDAVRAEEREACAQIAQSRALGAGKTMREVTACVEIAAAIRARGGKR